MATGSGVSAQDLEPRAYINTPVGLNFLIADYGYLAGGVATDPALPLQNADIKVHSTILAYARSLDVWGMSGKVDPRLRFSVNLYGAPAHVQGV